MSVSIASIKGVRPTNEDNEFVDLNIGKNNNKADINIVGIFDGHGGNQISKIVSTQLPILFLDKRISYPLDSKFVVKAFDFIQLQLINHHKSLASKMGTTALIAIQYMYKGANYLTVINIGDSRLVLCRNNLGTPITKDHKPYWPEETIRIKKLKGNIVNDNGTIRINNLSVSRAFGDLDAMPHVTHRPDMYKIKLEKTDKFIVMGCDGLWDVVSNSETVNFVLLNCYEDDLKTRNKNKSKDIANKLAEYAIKKGTTDNVSVIIMFFD